jgi:type III secretion protein V
MTLAHSSNRPASRLATVLRPELALVVMMALVVGMLILPLPPILVDSLIGLNMAIAIVIFLSSFYVDRILSFSTFPSVILFTTLIRLALSVSTSRLILLDADAGEIINAFGNFVVGDNLVVGFVVFAIVTLVQFIVITKGSERIGEVVARFSLDGMPGKQMSIDADLRASAITAEQAQRLRRDVERESQLYGSYDGAMKFVKGDAIAGIIILLVNLFGGIAVGMLQQKMSFSAALHTYTLLTIGDGLVAQIPALLICVSAGFVVTRVSGDSKNLGENILGELLASNKVLGIGAILVLLMGLLPGFPFLVFLALASGLVAMLTFRLRQARRTDENGVRRKADDGGQDDAQGKARIGVEAVAILVLVPEPVALQFDQAGIQALKERFQVQTGVRLPDLVVRPYPGQAQSFAVLIHEVVAATGVLIPDHVRVGGSPADWAGLELIVLPDAEGRQQAWAEPGREAALQTLGLTVLTQHDVVFEVLATAVIKNIGEVFGIQETKQVLDEVEARAPELIKELYRHMPIQRIAEVFQRLLIEDVSIRHVKVILEALVQWGQREKDVLLLVEHVRTSMARYICARHVRAERMAAVTVSPSTEDLVRSGIRQGQAAAFLNLEPAQSDDLIQRLQLNVGEANQLRDGVVLLVPADIRRFVKRLVEVALPRTPVLAFSELSDAVTLDILRTV